MAEKIPSYAITPIFDSLKSWSDIHQPLLAPIASPDVEVTLADLPIKAIHGVYHAELVPLLQAQEAIRAEEAGHQSVALGCSDVPSSVLAVIGHPPVGDSEAAMFYASLVGSL